MPTTLKTKNLTRNKAAETATLAEVRPSKVYCTLCTRTVDASVTVGSNMLGRRQLRVVAGQKCPRCSGSLDAAYVLSNLS